MRSVGFRVVTNGWRDRVWRVGPRASAWLACAIVLSAVQSHGQEGAQYVYVVRAVGNWVVRGGTGEPLRPLARIPVTAQIGVASAAAADTSYALVLRDPRSLRTATIRCVPVARCGADRRMADLSFGSDAVITSQRTGALFIHLGGGKEQRERIKLVGARGGAQDWGILVLALDSGTIDPKALISRIDADQATFVARICPLTSATSPAGACVDERAIRSEDCTLTPNARCAFPAAAAARIPVAIEVFERKGTQLAPEPVARAYAIVTREADRTRLTALAEEYWRDLTVLRGDVSPEEFDALAAAAVWEAARTAR